MTDPQQPDQHDRFCGAQKRQGEPGDTCHRPAGWGTSHPGAGRCKLHGGSTPDSTKHAETELARREAGKLGARIDIHPADALLELVQFQAGLVAFWQQQVEQLDVDDLVWGQTKLKVGGDDEGSTFEAAANIAYKLLGEATDRLERYSASALKANIDERRVKVAERDGRLLAAVIKRILAAQWAAMSRVLEIFNPTDEQRRQVEEAWLSELHLVVPRELRAIAAGDDPDDDEAET